MTLFRGRKISGELPLFAEQFRRERHEQDSRGDGEDDVRNRFRADQTPSNPTEKARGKRHEETRRAISYQRMSHPNIYAKE